MKIKTLNPLERHNTQKQPKFCWLIHREPVIISSTATQTVSESNGTTVEVTSRTTKLPTQASTNNAYTSDTTHTRPQKSTRSKKPLRKKRNMKTRKPITACFYK